MSTSTPSFEDVKGYNTNQLIDYLRSYLQENNLILKDSEIQNIRDEEINGYVFLDLTEELLQRLGFSMGKRVALIKLIKNLNSKSKFYHKIV